MGRKFQLRREMKDLFKLALLVKLVLVDSLLGKGSTGGCAVRIQSRMPVCRHVERPQIFALLHCAENSKSVG